MDRSLCRNGLHAEFVQIILLRAFDSKSTEPLVLLSLDPYGKGDPLFMPTHATNNLFYPP